MDVTESEPAVDTPFDVKLLRSGRRVTVPAGRSLLDALADAGVIVPSSCYEGNCGTCEVKVAAGRPLHRDNVLSESEKEEGRTMMACVSRSLDPVLELDL